MHEPPDAEAMHLCLHELDWAEFRAFKQLTETQAVEDHAFRVDILTEIRALRTDVTEAMKQMGEYLGMGKLIKFGVGTFCAVAGAVAAGLGAGHALGWW